MSTYPSRTITRQSGLFDSPRPLGIGILYNPSLSEFVHTELDTVDYVEIIPDMFWTDRGLGAEKRFEELESWVEIVEWLVPRCPLVGHDIGMSIATAGPFDIGYVRRLADWYARYPCAWHSDHLSFVRIVSGNGGHNHEPARNDHDPGRNAGLAAPVPYDHDVLDMLAARVAQVRRDVPAVFLLENNVYYVDIPEQEMSEPQFLNLLSDRSGCGLLLDVHNLYANSRNHGFDPFAFIDQLSLSRVVEVHVAGGDEMAGMYTDSHAGPCPEAVWALLDYVVPRAPNLCGITFEFHDSYYSRLNADGIRAQFGRMREAWARRQ